MAGLPPIGLLMELLFTWMFRLEVSVFFHGIRPGVLLGWVLCLGTFSVIAGNGFEKIWPQGGRIAVGLRGFVLGLGSGLTLGCVAIGLVLLPMAVFTLLVGVGLFGAVPFLVAAVLQQRVQDFRHRFAFEYTDAKLIATHWLALALGVATAWGAPLAMVVTYGYSLR